MVSKPTREELEQRIRQLEEKLSKVATSEQKLLRILAEEWDRTGPPGIMDIEDLAENLEMEPEGVRKIVQPLFERALVDRDNLMSAVYLTPEGYDQAKSE